MPHSLLDPCGNDESSARKASDEAREGNHNEKENLNLTCLALFIMTESHLENYTA
jgi:hypothetical protein